MIHHLSEKIGALLVAYGLPKENKEIYTYGAECFINLFICDFILLLWSIYFDCVWEMIIWIVTYTLLRNHLGGYHTQKNWQCMIASILLGILSLSTRTFWLAHPITVIITFILLMFCIITVTKIAPVLHPNHPLSAKRQKTERIRSIVIITAEVLAAAAVFFFDVSYCGAMISGIIMATLFAVVGHLKKFEKTDAM